MKQTLQIAKWLRRSSGRPDGIADSPPGMCQTGATHRGEMVNKLCSETEVTHLPPCLPVCLSLSLSHNIMDGGTTNPNPEEVTEFLLFGLMHDMEIMLFTSL